MLCQTCGQRGAAVSVSEIVADGACVERWVCLPCAEGEGFPFGEIEQAERKLAEFMEQHGRPLNEEELKDLF
jgi:protein-arginine kinase activator protein McsA